MYHVSHAQCTHSNGDLHLSVFLKKEYSDVIEFFKGFEVQELSVGNRDTRINFQRYVVIVFNHF